MSRLRVLKVYSVRHPLNQRTRHDPVKGLTLSVHTDWETLGEMGEMLIMMCSSFVSVAVADVPDSPVVISGEGTATLTDLLSFLCFSQHVCLDGFHGGEDHRVCASFVDDETVSDFVTVLHVLGKFVCVHALSIGHRSSKGEGTCDSSCTVYQFASDAATDIVCMGVPCLGVCSVCDCTGVTLINPVPIANGWHQLKMAFV